MVTPTSASPTPQPPRPGGWRQAVESLSAPQFRRIFTSNLAFFLAMGGQGIVRPWLAFQLTGSAFDLGLVSAAVALPMLVLAPFGGVLADRLERRGLIMCAQSLAIFSEGATLVLLVTNRLEFWHLVVTAGIMGCAFPLIMPARQAIVVNIVGKRGLGAAVALNMAGVNVTRVVGPAMAGFLIPVIAVKGVYAMNLLLYVFALLAMTRVARVPAPTNAGELTISRNLLDGFRYVWSNRLILVLLAYGLVPMFLVMPVQALYVIFAEEVWQAGPTGLGILSASAGIGAVVGSFLVAGRGPDAGRLRLMMLSVIAFGVSLAGFAGSPWFFVAIPFLFVGNIFSSIFGTLNNTAIQLLIPDVVRGRISSFLMMSFSLPLLGTLPVAAAAERFGASAAVGVSSILAVLASVAFYAGSRELRSLDARVRHAMSQD